MVLELKLGQGILESTAPMLPQQCPKSGVSQDLRRPQQVLDNLAGEPTTPVSAEPGTEKRDELRHDSSVAPFVPQSRHDASHGANPFAVATLHSPC